MAEVLAVGAAVIAIIQITDRIIGLCKFYIEAERGIPSSLHSILVEISMLKAIFENLDFLRTCNSGISSTMSTLYGQDGPVEGCRRSITKLEKLFPSDCVQNEGQPASKKRRVMASLSELAWPLKENKAKKLLDEIKGHKSSITLALTTESIQDIKDIKMKASEMQNMLTESQRQEVYKWLLHTDPSPLHHRAQEQYEHGTGSWMLRTPGWANWLDAKQCCLWIHGIPGAGKTILMSYLIEQIKQHCGQSQTTKVAYAYYYSYFGHDQDEAVPFLRWLLNQLCRQADLVPGNVYKMYKYGGEPSLVDLLNALEDLLDKFEITYVIVDAIDESKPRENLLKVLQNLATDSRFTKLQLLASSREYPDIERVMEEFSVAVPMANLFVEADIRHFVRSTLQSDRKFKQWPQVLLDEVESAVSTGAKGMFRWAVCQIDVLRRLKPERDVVKNALANLPKTLYETYDRIFLRVPEEERLFVYHALQWISYHNELYDGDNIPCAILLQAVVKSTAALTTGQNERFYNKETLRELCGCLINLTLEDRTDNLGERHYTTLAASFAHYTVREYLDSTSISKNFTVCLTASEENFKEKFMKITLLEAQCIKQNEVWEQEYRSEDGLDVTEVLDGDFNAYCVASALVSLRKWPSEITQQHTLSNLVIDLLNPSEPNFQILCGAAWHLEPFITWPSDMEPQRLFWTLKWNPHPKEAAAVHLLNILLMSDLVPKHIALAERFLQTKDTYDFLQTRLSFTVPAWFLDEGIKFDENIFDGSIIEVFAQLSSADDARLKLLLKYGTGLFDPSKVLLLFIGLHMHEHCDDYCIVEHLLELGADPNLKEYRVTPLQIAVWNFDFKAVSILLKAGADPNGTGNADAIVWGECTPMSRFNRVHNVRPLDILASPKEPRNRLIERIEMIKRIKMIERIERIKGIERIERIKGIERIERIDRIESLLREYGAK